MVVITDWKLLEPGSEMYFAEVLKDINAIRAEYMLSPLEHIPMGVPHVNFSQCVLGRALGSARASHIVNDARRYDDDFQWARTLDGDLDRLNTPQPTLICDFENRFEDGQFPALELNR